MKPLRESTIDTQYVLRAVFVVGLSVAIVLYINFQARNLISGPEITLSHELPTIQHERMITIEGTAKNIVALTLNGKQIHTDEHGVFARPVVLENGYTILTLTAEDRYGRTVSFQRAFVYEPEITL